MSFNLFNVVLTISTLFFFQSALSEEFKKSDFVVNVTRNSKVTLIAYGDMRFTDPSELIASHPAPRRSLVDSIAKENPSAIFLSGDVPWHGGVLNDYDVYKTETIAWQKNKIPVYPALGNHEFSQCEELVCLANWWQTFPQLNKLRWYSVKVGPSFRAIALDSDASLSNGSYQRNWLEAQLENLDSQEKFIMVYLHHPPVSDLETGSLASHNPRENEKGLAEYLSKVAKKNPSVNVFVVAGHIHNYERLVKDSVTYFVSGGGGAKPYIVTRSNEDFFQNKNPVNFHYLRMTLEHKRLLIEMVRLKDPDSPIPNTYEVADSLEMFME
jgi:hypothetical protein